MIHLRIRTEYSFGDAYAPIPRVIERLKALGCTAAGVVDRHGTWAHVRWFNACKEEGIAPLLGVELPVGDDQRAMWFLARSTEGLKELYRFSSLAYRQALPSKRGEVPNLRYDDVIAMSGDIIKFSGEVLDEPFLVASGAILDLNPSSRVLNHAKRQIGQRCGLGVVETADNAYAFPEDRPIYELLGGFGLKPTPQHIIELPDCALATQLATGCAGLALPKAPMIREEGDLEAICRAGIGFRRLDWNEVYETRLKYELDLIRSKDFESYFLVVADMMRFAKDRMLVGPARGSSAGSLVCYLSRITEIDPIPAGLFFERFIDVSRSDLPDIDSDFPDDKRHLVFEYAAEKYGKLNTAHIGTISTFKPKSALIQVCKQLNIPPTATAGVKAAMIERSSADSRANNCLLDTLNETEPGRALQRMYPQVMLSTNLEGHATHTGVHAAGLLICNEPLENFATITNHGIAQVEKGAAESLGLLKVDVLGLRTLGILEDAGLPIDWYNLKFDDPATYEVFNRQKLCGIFQFEGSAMRAVSRQMTFRSLIDIDAVTALARPGPFGGGVTKDYLDRRAGKSYEAIHPLVAVHMQETFGLPVYQEQTLAIVRYIGKFDWKETSTIRKAMSKRMGKEFFDKMWEKFREGATSQGIDVAEARKIWEMINSMGAWAMNKAHTYSYAVVSYWTAYLKAHHPLEFAAANLRNTKDEDTSLRLLREAVQEGLQYSPFDIELSEETWCVKEGRLIAGFNALKGFGDIKAKKYVAARVAGQLTQKMREEALKAENVFSDIFPMQTRFGHFYSDPESSGVMGKVYKIGELDGEQEGSIVFIGMLVHKNARNANEGVNVKKRNGRLMRGPLDFLDIKVQDDTGMISARVDRYKFIGMGKEILETIPLNTPVMVRANFKKGIRFGFIQKFKVLE